MTFRSTCAIAARALAPGLLLAAAACAGGDSTISVRCENACQRDEKCDLGVGSPFCADSCEERSEALLAPFRDSYMDCYAEVDCEGDIAACENAAGNLVERRPADQAYQIECQAVHSDCEEGFDVDYCFFSHYFEAPVVQAAQGCLVMNCDALQACLQREMPFSPFSRGD